MLKRSELQALLRTALLDQPFEAIALTRADIYWTFPNAQSQVCSCLKEVVKQYQQRYDASLRKTLNLARTPLELHRVRSGAVSYVQSEARRSINTMFLGDLDVPPFTNNSDSVLRRLFALAKVWLLEYDEYFQKYHGEMLGRSLHRVKPDLR